ncbi:16S rRNA (cytidine(1402)-2'-O)-methyltransferase [Comamonas serinivorans]|uniref:Ribosomal RNA small subunit methyltransferase I n=1 Tax=Comamonas serinivorans TaxID=1082851 RepID=A0A1Y0EJN9_9BURK|nr:16S rRNA (cytidine(1402)-2'-O)-methyltransferase [Comamonas serinivorans]ARU03864.1 16S rRNA (cytidine(1402)-2'-O)-methyltransferase [Comamonas serinivorans]
MAHLHANHPAAATPPAAAHTAAAPTPAGAGPQALPALQAALNTLAQAASTQDLPAGALYVVATPIGNRADFSVRALLVLALVDAVACEDTRHTRQLLQACGLDRSVPMLAVHQHNEAEAAAGVIARLQRGERVAYVSDAGTPAVSDPGARLVAAVVAAQLRVLPLPGASSVTTALSVAGVVGASWGKGASAASSFVFEGFLPTKAGERREAVAALARQPRTVVLLEAPHRIADLAADLAVLGERPVTVGRELTKQFEQVATLPASALPGWLAADAQRQRGEFALVLHATQAPAAGDDTTPLLSALLAELPLKSAVRLAAQITGAPRNALYDQALSLKQASSDEG